jgi:hypothetical protein
MTPAATARLAATFFGIVYAALLYYCGVVVPVGTKQLIAYLPSAAALLIVVFDKWAWKWWPLTLIFRRPHIEGAWLTTIRPSSDSHIPLGGNRGPITAATIIEQSYFSLHVTQYTAESTSHSTTASIRTNGESRERTTLSLVYCNEPKQQHQPRSLTHSGASEIFVTGREPNELDGRYWTSRLTTGDLTFVFIDRRTDYPNLAAVLGAQRERKP